MFEKLEIHIAVKGKMYLITVAVKIELGKYRAYQATHNTISQYTINRVVEAGYAIMAPDANEIFPVLANDFNYDETP